MKVYLGIKKWVIIATIAIILAIIIGIPLGKWAVKPAECADSTYIANENGQSYKCQASQKLEFRDCSNCVIVVCRCKGK